MKQKILCILLLFGLMIMAGCGKADVPQDITEATQQITALAESPEETKEGTMAATEPEETKINEVTTAPTQQIIEPTEDPVPTTAPAVGETTNHTTQQASPVKPSQPKPTEPKFTEPPKPTTAPTEPHTEVTVPLTTEPEKTQPAETEPEPYVPTGEFKRQVAQYAAHYINQYRLEAGVGTCTVLPRMTLVAEYRADQLCYNYSHSTADKREALAHYQYGRWVDATLAGMSASDSYYEADTSEAICAGFKGTDAEEMGKYIANMIRKSSSHWRYVGSAEYSYIAVGVEYRENSEYRWYGCVMVGTVDYG